MFTATIVQKGIKDGAFLVNVSYTNGSVSFNEVYDMTGGTLEVLNQKVKTRLDTLNATATLIPQVTTGPIAPTTAADTAAITFVKAMRHFQSCKRAADLGLIKNTDAVYTQAQADMLSLYDPSFIDQV